MSLKQTIDEKLTALSETEFTYIETSDINKADEIDFGCTGIYMEATVIYFEIKSLPFFVKVNGRRKAAQIYTIFHEMLSSIAEADGGIVNCYSPEAFLIIYPGKENDMQNAVKSALRIASVGSEALKTRFGSTTALEFAMGLDHGHIMGTKNLSDNGLPRMTWFGSCIMKAKQICHHCSKPYFVGVSSIIYHSFDKELLVTTRRILGIKKRVEIWTKLSYQFDNEKKHLYQTNHKLDFEEAQ